MRGHKKQTISIYPVIPDLSQRISLEEILTQHLSHLTWHCMHVTKSYANPAADGDIPLSRIIQVSIILPGSPELYESNDVQLLPDQKRSGAAVLVGLERAVQGPQFNRKMMAWILD